MRSGSQHKVCPFKMPSDLREGAELGREEAELGRSNQELCPLVEELGPSELSLVLKL